MKTVIFDLDNTLYPEEKALLKKFSEITGMEIKDMGNLTERDR